MFELKVKVDFPAAHHIVGYDGDCARPHGHNWALEAFVTTPALNDIGIAVDFRALKKAVKELVAAWDHQDLNTLPDFKDINPTAETLAMTAFKKLNVLLVGSPTRLARVTIWENDRCSATYYE